MEIEGARYFLGVTTIRRVSADREFLVGESGNLRAAGWRERRRAMGLMASQAVHKAIVPAAEELCSGQPHAAWVDKMVEIR